MNTLTYPTLDEYYQAFLTANGEFDKADGTKLAEYESMFTIKNSRLRGHILTRRTAVASWSWDLIPFDKANAETASIAKERIRDVVEQIIPQRINTSLFGFYAADIEFALDEESKQRKPKLVKRYLPDQVLAVKADALRFKEGDKVVTQPKSLLQAKGDKISPILTIIEIDGEDYRGGQLASIGVSELLRVDTMSEWLNWAKKQKGMIQGIDKGMDEDGLANASSMMSGLLKNNYIISDDSFEVLFHQIANSTAGGSFKDLKEEFNSAIAIAILGQANVSELPKGGGSRAAVEVQAKVSRDIMFSDVLACERLINKQLLPFDYASNYGSPNPPYRFVVRLAEEEDYESNSVVVREALGSGVPLLKSEVYDKLGFSVPAEGEEIITGSAV